MKLWDSFVRFLMELFGSGRRPFTWEFEDFQVITDERPVYVWAITNALYITLHPTMYAVAIGPSGKAILLKGGFNFPLPPGRYSLHYVDKRDRTNKVETRQTTSDGAKVSLTLLITYRVCDPIRAFDVPDPVGILLAAIQSDLNEYIRSHAYDEIIGSIDGQVAESALIARYIKQRHNGRQPICRIFVISDVTILERAGDPDITGIRKDYQVQQKQKVAETQLSQQQQKLETLVASQEAQIRQIRAEADLKQQEILQKVKLKEVAIENARQQMRMKQEQWERAVEAISQTLSVPNYQRGQQEMEVLQALLAEMHRTVFEDVEAASQQPAAAPPGPGKPTREPANKMDSLTSTLLGLLAHKKS